MLSELKAKTQARLHLSTARSQVRAELVATAARARAYGMSVQDRWAAKAARLRRLYLLEFVVFVVAFEIMVAILSYLVLLWLK